MFLSPNNERRNHVTKRPFRAISIMYFSFKNIENCSIFTRFHCLYVLVYNFSAQLYFTKRVYYKKYYCDFSRYTFCTLTRYVYETP